MTRIVLVVLAVAATTRSQSAAATPREPEPTPAQGNCEYTPPAGWQEQHLPDHILLAQSPDPMACRIQILPLQPSSGDLEQDAKAVFATMYAGWAFTRSGEQQYDLTRGFLPRGLEYCMMEAPMSATDADGGYHLEDGAALVIRAGERIAIVAVRHGALLAHGDCLNKYDTWRRFFNSFTVPGAPVPARAGDDDARRIVGVWKQSGGRALSEYAFAANGHYAFSGAVGTSWTTSDANYEYLHTRTHDFAGDGSYTIAGDMLTLTPHRDAAPEKVRFRFEQVNHGGTGWRDRLYFLSRDNVGDLEVCYEKR